VLGSAGSSLLPNGIFATSFKVNYATTIEHRLRAKLE
jgi:hypothetical protein